jgi:hypothetical protein
VRRLRGALAELHQTIEAGRQAWVALNPDEHSLRRASPLQTRITEMLGA